MAEISGSCSGSLSSSNVSISQEKKTEIEKHKKEGISYKFSN